MLAILLFIDMFNSFEPSYIILKDWNTYCSLRHSRALSSAKLPETGILGVKIEVSWLEAVASEAVDSNISCTE